MPNYFKLVGAALAFAICAQGGAAEQTGLTVKERYAHAMSLQAEAPERTVELLHALADEGDARALDRLAYFTFKGVGTEKDVAGAIELYRDAVDAGRSSSLVSLGKVYMTEGAHEMAIETLLQASAAGHIKADAVLAWANATGRLGEFSEKDAGFETLAVLANDDLREAQMYLLDAAARNQKTPDNIAFVLDRLHARHQEGDAKAAEALLRFYRMRRHVRGSLTVRADLLTTDGLRDKIRIEEGLYLAAEQEPQRFWVRSEALVQAAPPDVYARALSVAARINRNAYVRIVQKELRDHGYQVGRPSPYMNRPLISAINQFCRDADIVTECRLGPLKSTTIKAVAGKLAGMRSTF